MGGEEGGYQHGEGHHLTQRELHHHTRYIMRRLAEEQYNPFATFSPAERIEIRSRKELWKALSRPWRCVYLLSYFRYNYDVVRVLRNLNCDVVYLSWSRFMESPHVPKVWKRTWCLITNTGKVIPIIFSRRKYKFWSIRRLEEVMDLISAGYSLGDIAAEFYARYRHKITVKRLKYIYYLLSKVKYAYEYWAYGLAPYPGPPEAVLEGILHAITKGNRRVAS